jgi:hypothetical protein
MPAKPKYNHEQMTAARENFQARYDDVLMEDYQEEEVVKGYAEARERLYGTPADESFAGGVQRCELPTVRRYQ